MEPSQRPRRDPRVPSVARLVRWPADFPSLAEGLVDAGFSTEDTAKILGGNWRRLYGEVIG